MGKTMHELKRRPFLSQKDMEKLEQEGMIVKKYPARDFYNQLPGELQAKLPNREYLEKALNEWCKQVKRRAEGAKLQERDTLSPEERERMRETLQKLNELLKLNLNLPEDMKDQTIVIIEPSSRNVVVDLVLLPKSISQGGV